MKMSARQGEKGRKGHRSGGIPSLKLTVLPPENRGFPLGKRKFLLESTVFIRGKLLVLGRVYVIDVYMYISRFKVTF